MFPVCCHAFLAPGRLWMLRGSGRRRCLPIVRRVETGIALVGSHPSLHCSGYDEYEDEYAHIITENSGRPSVEQVTQVSGHNQPSFL